MFSRSIIKYAVSIGLLVFLLAQMDLDSLLFASSGVNVWLMAVSVVLVLGQIFFLNLRWHEYMNVPKPRVEFRDSVLMNVLSYFANVLFITSVGGILAKSAMAIRYGVPVVQAIFITFLDRFMTLFALIVFCAIGLPFLSGALDKTVFDMLAMSVIFVILGFALFLVLLRKGIFNDYILGRMKLARFAVFLRLFTADDKLITTTALYSLAAQLCFIISVYVLSLGLEYPADRTLEFLSLLPVLFLISSLPISFGGWGVREGAFMYGLSLIGFSMEDAFLLSVQVGLVGMIAPFSLGVRYYLTGDLNKFLVPLLPKFSNKNQA